MPLRAPRTRLSGIKRAPVPGPCITQTAVQGEQLFHGGLNSKITVSCDQCHPNAGNTHPETYPKFQQQLGRVAVLGEMTNWCIENPLESDPLALNDPRMVAIQAYITQQRRKVLPAPGKH